MRLKFLLADDPVGTRHISVLDLSRALPVRCCLNLSVSVSDNHTRMLELWSSSDGLTQLVLIIQAVVFLASGIVLAATMRKAQLERQSKAEQAIALATAQRDAANARLEAAQLNAVLMPIELTTDQQKALAAACGRFRGKVVQIRANSPDPESWVLADLIAEPLRAAGLQVERTQIGGITFEGMSPGIIPGGPDADFVSGVKRR